MIVTENPAFGQSAAVPASVIYCGAEQGCYHRVEVRLDDEVEFITVGAKHKDELADAAFLVRCIQRGLERLHARRLARKADA